MHLKERKKEIIENRNYDFFKLLLLFTIIKN